MKTALVVASAAPGGTDFAADLGAAGFHVIGAAHSGNLVREAVRLAPDLIASFEVSADDGLFDACALLASAAPRPVVVFTRDPDATKIERALRSGIHAYVINGYGLNRLRSVVHLAQARFEHERKLHAELSDVTRRFEERKLVDRAKGILMRARQLSEEDAFRVLRTASMAAQRRVGQTSQQVIDAAHYAEAVNRAGKLRMLSQRLVKLCALQWLEPTASGDATAALLADSVQQLDANIAALGKSLSPATFGDLLDAVSRSWAVLRALVANPPSHATIHSTNAADASPLGEVDRQAEQLLAHADQLTRHLETAGLVTTLHVINVSGRQRMLSQRCAKQALLGVLHNGDAARRTDDDLTKTALAFEQAMDYLATIPLSTREIRELLAAAQRTWGDLADACTRARTPAGQRALGDASETLVAQFEMLTDHYERSMQVLMG